MKARLVALVAIATTVSAYAGSRNTHFQGLAGPYPVRVSIRTPGVIPGLADITVLVADAADVEAISVQPLFWNVPLEHAPAPDRATRGTADEYHAQLWLMVSGSYGVRVLIDGARGEGSVIVPVTAVAFERLDMPVPLGVALLGLAAFLAAGLITIVRAAARESTLSPGAIADRQSRRRGWMGLASGSMIVALALVAGRAWWNSVDTAYRQRLYRPPELRASVTGGGSPLLRLVVRDSAWLLRRPLVRDEGKLAHILVVNDLAFAHLHPLDGEDSIFQTALPPLPEGEYRVFVEVTDSSGFTETLTTTTRIPAPPRLTEPGITPAIDGFWSVRADQTACPAVTDHAACRLLQEGVSLVRRTDRPFAFSIHPEGRRPFAIDWSADEPADAVVITPDGAMAHVRPHGTMSTAAIEHFTPAGAPQSIPLPREVDFPYAISELEAGRAWVQVKAGGRSYIAAFDLKASPASP